MNRRAPVAALFAAWILAGAVAFAQPADPQIKVTPTSLPFGTLCVGKSATKAVTVENLAEEGGPDLEVTIARVGAGNGFSQPNPTSMTVSPQATDDFSVTFSSALPPGTRSATFRVTSNDPDPDDDVINVAASASVVHRLIAVDASTVAFGEQRVGTRSPNKTLTIRNPGQDAISVTSIKRLGANGVDFVVAAPAVPFSVPANDYRTVTIAFQPTGEGLRKGTLEILSNSCTQPKLNVSLVGTGVFPNVMVEPNPIDAGASPVGKASKPIAITVSNEGQAALKITAVQIIGSDAADFVLTGLPPVPKTLQPGESFVFNLRMKPTEEGLRLASINVLSDDPDGSTFTVSVRGTGTPPVSPSPSASASASVTATPSASPTATSTAVPGTPNDSLAIMLVVGGVLSAFVGLMVVRRFVRTPDDD
jgi:hypothetical protein